MHRLHYLQALDTRANVWLVCHDDDQKTGLAQGQCRAFHSREKLKFRKSRRRIRLSVADHGAINDAIAIKEYCPFHLIRPGNLTGRPHHLVAICCRSGWDTRQCHTTA